MTAIPESKRKCAFFCHVFVGVYVCTCVRVYVCEACDLAKGFRTSKGLIVESTVKFSHLRDELLCVCRAVSRIQRPVAEREVGTAAVLQWHAAQQADLRRISRPSSHLFAHLSVMMQGENGEWNRRSLTLK